MSNKQELQRKHAALQSEIRQLEARFNFVQGQIKLLEEMLKENEEEESDE